MSTTSVNFPQFQSFEQNLGYEIEKENRVVTSVNTINAYNIVDRDNLDTSLTAL